MSTNNNGNIPKLPDGTWGLRSSWSKRIFIVALAALAARKETGSTSPESCRELAAIFGAEADFEFFLTARDDGVSLSRLNQDTLIAVAKDAYNFNDDRLRKRLEKEGKKRKIDLFSRTSREITTKRKFSFE